MVLYAHSAPDKGPDHWEELIDHLRNVAAETGTNCASFDAERLGQIAGWLRDLGKSKPRFQRKLHGERNNEPHSGEGAAFAHSTFGPILGKMLAFTIAGHHSGLPNGARRSEHRPPAPLSERISASETLELFDGLSLPRMEIPNLLATSEPPTNFTLQLFTRMLFASLVDADFIETERFYADGKGRPPAMLLDDLLPPLDKFLSGFGSPKNNVNRARAEILSHAKDAASQEPGFFSMTVPTGGGKTLSSLKFALEHANRHNLRRVIYVAPFTSIIEQTADVFRTALGSKDAVLEHHSSFESADILTEDEAERMKLAGQNWDRPVVVTTAVQFYESLFANRTQKCRKLHNIAKSVVILDEAQSLPVPFLHPCLASLNELVARYGCSVVFCTATQPAIFKEQGLDLDEAPTRAAVREIAPDPARLFRDLKRVTVQHVGALDNEALVERVAGLPALVIVNNKTHARTLFDAMRGAGVFHLSTNMTAAHRRATLAEIRERLAIGRGATTISTALIEAGVDISFPEVWRATAGLDSIAQAAGRCNREGQMEGMGQVYVFDPPEEFPPPPELKQNAETARHIMARFPDVLSPEAIEGYFAELYWDNKAGLDAKAIMARINATKALDFDFADIAHDFRLIDDITVPLIIGVGPWGVTPEARGMLRHADHAGVIARTMQPFTVQVMPHLRQSLLGSGDVSLERPDLFGQQFAVLDNVTLYDPDAGFSMQGQEVFDGFLSYTKIMKY